jgi:hypothetical protein
MLLLTAAMAVVVVVVRVGLHVLTVMLGLCRSSILY